MELICLLVGAAVSAIVMNYFHQIALRKLTRELEAKLHVSYGVVLHNWFAGHSEGFTVIWIDAENDKEADNAAKILCYSHTRDFSNCAYTIVKIYRGNRDEVHAID